MGNFFETRLLTVCPAISWKGFWRVIRFGDRAKYTSAQGCLDLVDLHHNEVFVLRTRGVWSRNTDDADSLAERSGSFQQSREGTRPE